MKCKGCDKEMVPREGESPSAFKKRKYCSVACLRPYPSRYGANGLTAAGYLAENMMAKAANRGGVGLPRLFWKLPQWKKQYENQLRHAAALLAQWPIAAVLAGLRTTEGRRAYSLAAPWLPALIVAEVARMALLESQPAVAPPPPPPTTSEPPRPAFVRPGSAMDKLRKLDG